MTTTVRFRMMGGEQPLHVLPVMLNGLGPLDFALDTGATVTMVPPDIAARAAISVESTARGAGAAGPIEVGIGTADQLAFGAETILRPRIVISSEVDRISRAIDDRLDGVLGHNVLKDFALELDYAAGLLHFTRSDGSAAAGIAFALAAPAKPLMLVDVLVNGSGPYRFAVDTGASTSVVSTTVATREHVASRPMPLVTGAGGTAVVTAGEGVSLTVGNAHVGATEVLVGDFLTPLSQALGTELDGILGYNFLREFRVTIDYPAGRLLLR